ncbi:hypothetical protein [Agrococcus sp. Marseille-P2731]|uniref:hypothetical protein n=1 Tax=Agrococcus sp. Marseille-P2731 TaxID=1841862 RepID=UPI0009304D31|nr:hypothetical protein [Agrococcus sp. Marseille-P2731]
MDITWIIVIAVVALVGVVGTVALLLGERAPRARVDRERLARLRERVAASEALRRSAQLERRILEDRGAARASGERQRQQPLGTERLSTERLWAGGL